MIQTVDNYHLLPLEIKTSKKDRDDFLKDKSYYCLSDYKTPKELHYTLKDFISKSENNTFFSFFKDKEKRDAKNEDDLIISIRKDNENNYIAQTGNYIGKFVWDGLEIDIKSRFSNVFLERMLNFANDVYLDDVSVSGNESKDLDISKFIICYMFVQNLEKAFLLGLPKSYRSVKHHDMKLKGKIDINRFIKNDIPFKGKISSVSREQREIQEVIDVLYKAVKIIESKFNTKNISHIKTHLKQNKSNMFVSNETITKAMNSKALQNPIFAPYKKVLKYAKFIIDGNNIEQAHKGKNETYGFLIDVSELFEMYLYKLLQQKFPEWEVIHEDDLGVYSGLFYERRMLPDIVMKKDKKVMVFDAKYKRMTFKNRYQYGGDLDRNDFFQINTYMSYYQNSGYEVIAGGLLYPMEGKFDANRCHSQEWLGNKNTKFVVDGLDLSQLGDKKIEEIEVDFIERIKNLIAKI